MNANKMLKRTLNTVVRDLTTRSIDLSSDRIAEIQKMRSEFDRSMGYIELNHSEKLKNRLDLATVDYSIVSIGQNCLPRTLSTRWGLKKTRAEGELTCPFDLAVHPPSSVRKILEEKFSHYTNPKYFSLSPQKVPRHTRYDVVFNHERSLEFIEDDFSRLRKAYKPRIENFYRVVKGQKNLLFVMNLHFIPDRKNLDTLYSDFEVIARILRDIAFDKCRFLVLDTRRKSDKRRLEDGFESASYFRIPEPYENYVWHESIHFSSPEGIAFEQEIASVMKSILLSGFSRSE